MEFLEAKLPEEILQEYPYPLAVAAARVNNSTERVEKFLALARLAEITLKYLAVIGLAEYLRDPERNEQVQSQLAKLPRPSLGVWNGMLNACMTFQANLAPGRVVVPELRQSCDERLRPDNHAGRALLEWFRFVTGFLDGKPDGRRSLLLKEALDLLVRYRNKTWGHGIAQVTPEFCEPHEAKLASGLGGLLVSLGWLSRYPLRYVKEVRKHKGQDVHVMFDYMGRVGQQGQSYTGEYVREERLYLCDPSGRPRLCVHPLFVLHERRMYVLDYYETAQGQGRAGFSDCEDGHAFTPEHMSSLQIAKLADDTHGKLGDSELPVPPQQDGLSVDESALGPGLSELLEQLDEPARHALELGLGEALRIGRFWLGIEFVLMGLSRVSGTMLGDLLREIRLDPGEFRGGLRSIAGVATSDDWRRVAPESLGQSAWATLKEVASPDLAKHFDPAARPAPVVTQRLLAVLRAAVELAKGRKAGPDDLFAAVLAHPHCVPVNFLLGCVHKAGKDPREILKRMQERIGGPPPAPVARQPGNEPVAGPPARPGAPADQPPGPQAPAPPLAPLGGLLGRHGRDLTSEARAGGLRPAVGAEALLRRIKRTLIRRDIRNPLLVGEPGVGKTALVEGLAYDLVHHGAGLPKELASRRIVELSLNSLVAGTRHHGEIEERLEGLMQQVKASAEVIVFIDELHMLMGDRGSGSVLADALKPVLARGEFPCIGATTVAEYRRFVEKDAALSRRFEVIMVPEPEADLCVQIARAHAEELGVRIGPGAVEAAVRLSARYVPDERLPAKAIKLLEEAAAYVRLPSFSAGDAAGEGGPGRPLFVEVSEDLIRYLLAQKTGIPLERLAGDERQRIAGIEAALNAQVIGQPEAVRVVAQVVKAAYAGVRDPRKPIGVFLFVGPTGVGKTELARALARFLFDDVNALIRLDMSEYLERHQVSRLIGAPPGYVGHEEEGQLTGKLRLRPHSVVLLDEIEKAHEEVHNLFLQLFDEGRLTDSKGRTVDGREAIFIMTSNVGAEVFVQDPIGYLQREQLSPEWLKEKQDAIAQAVRQRFKPEFRNRLDGVVHFKPLLRPELPAVFDLQFRALQERLLASHQLTLRISPAAVRHVCDRGFDPLNGARPLKRALGEHVEGPLTELLLSGKVEAGDTITIDCTAGALGFHPSRT